MKFRLITTALLTLISSAAFGSESAFTCDDGSTYVLARKAIYKDGVQVAPSKAYHYQVTQFPDSTLTMLVRRRNSGDPFVMLNCYQIR